MSILPIALLQMNVWVVVLMTVAVLALLVIVYIAGLKRGVKTGIEFGMRYSIDRTINELRKSADKKGCTQILEEVIQTLNTTEKEYLKK